MDIQETVNQPGLWDRIKSSLKLEGLQGKFGDYKEVLFEIALYGGLGFLLGFLTRRYSGYILLFISFFVLLFFLVRFDLMIVVVNWEKLNELFGIQAMAIDDTNVMSSLWLWVQNNITISVSFALGFLLGLKFG